MMIVIYPFVTAIPLNEFPNDKNAILNISQMKYIYSKASLNSLVFSNQ